MTFFSQEESLDERENELNGLDNEESIVHAWPLPYSDVQSVDLLPYKQIYSLF